jgi:hypothetical protein
MQVKCVEVFKEFYQTKTKHRKLTWIYSLGTCNITGKFDAKPIELVVTTYQVFTECSSTVALFVVLARLSLPMEGRSAYLVKLWLLWSDVVIVTNLLP